MDIASIDYSILAAPFILFLFGITILVWIAMLGGSLQLSLWLLVDEPPRYLVCLAVSLGIIALNTVLYFSLALLLGPQQFYIVGIYMLALQMLVVMLCARCNPITAFLAAVCNGVFSVMGTAFIAVFFFILTGVLISGAMEQHEKATEETAQAQTLPTGPKMQPLPPTRNTAPSKVEVAPGQVANPFFQ